MKEKKKYPAWHIYLAVFLSIIWILFMFLFAINPDLKIIHFNKGYKQGQIDCLNGIQNYDKAVKKDTIYFKIK